MSERFRIGIVTDDETLGLQPAGLRAALWGMGHTWILLDGSELATDNGHKTIRSCDMVVAHTSDLVTLCLLAGMEALNVPTINSSSAIARVQDKTKLLGVLQATRVPSVPAYIGNAQVMSAGLASHDYPLAVRLADAAVGGWIGVFHTPDELLAVAPADQSLIAQTYHSVKRQDHRLYVIGESVWGVQSEGDASSQGWLPTATELGPIPVDPAERELALRCGALFGLELYEVQTVLTSEGRRVVDINAFPDYTGLPGASGRLATYVARRAREEHDHTHQGA